MSLSSSTSGVGVNMAKGTRVGTGWSLNREAAEAAREAVAQARLALEGRPPQLVLLFATTGHDQQALVHAVRDAAGGAQVLGCSGEGVIGAHGSDEGSHAVALAALASEDVGFHAFSIPGLSADPAACARELARQVAAATPDGRLLLLFPDGISAQLGDFLPQLDEALPYPLTVAGGTAGDMLSFQKTWQYFGGEARTDSLSALLVSGAVDAELTITHGCGLIGSEKTVTAAAGGEMLELDHEPAWDYFRRYLPEETQTLNAMHVAHLVVAERLPKAVEDFGEVLIRVPLRLDAERGSLFFAAGFAPGTVVQMALRDAPLVARRAEQAAAELSARRDEPPLLVIELDCAGRGRLLFGEETNARLIRPQQAAFAEGTPWVGLHTFGEIAPVGGRTRFHNYTGVLCALYPSR